ncbi:MAG: hypothetical protein WKF55_14545 [Gemmatimonadaceae bacterium]
MRISRLFVTTSIFALLACAEPASAPVAATGLSGLYSLAGVPQLLIGSPTEEVFIASATMTLRDDMTFVEIRNLETMLRAAQVKTRTTDTTTGSYSVVEGLYGKEITLTDSSRNSYNGYFRGTRLTYFRGAASFVFEKKL